MSRLYNVLGNLSTAVESKEELKNYLEWLTSMYLPGYSIVHHFDTYGNIDEVGDYVGWIEDILVAIYEHSRVQAGSGEIINKSYIKVFSDGGGTTYGDGEYTKDSVITLKAFPYPGYTFKRWRSIITDQTYYDNPLIYTVTNEADIIQAVFE